MTTHGTTVVITERRWELPPASTSVHVGGDPSRDGHDDNRCQCYMGNMQIGGSLPPRSHAVPIVSLLTLARDRFPFSCMCYYPRDGCDNSRKVNPPPFFVIVSHPPTAIRAPPLSATRCGGDRDSRDAGPTTAWRRGRLVLRATSPPPLDH